MADPASRSILVTLDAEDDIAGFRKEARRLLAERVPPDRVVWRVAGSERDLFGAEPARRASKAEVSLPRAAVELAQAAAHHSDPGRWPLLYTFLHRSLGEKALADNPADPLVRRLRQMEKAVRRDAHKMHAFVRFKEVEDPGGGPSRYIAWFEPDHHIVEREAPFFIRRFANMHWAIVTPRRSIRWEDGQLRAGPGGRREDVPQDDAFDEAWRAYYASIFNPARVKVSAMTAEMPRKYWRNLPEARLIPEMIETASARVATMAANALADEERGIAEAAPRRMAAPVAMPAIRALVRSCTNCPLHGPATQAVPGEGPADARLFLVGEQPGDMEDLEGRPFVGPAGQVLNQALEQAGLDRERAYLTNAVKHFKFELRGKRRLHRSPSAENVDACSEWLLAEHQAVAPAVTVTLGATALRGLLGKSVPLARVRGTQLALPSGGALIPTFHPSYLLRLQDEGARRIEEGKFLSDLRRARELLAA
ncbi:UdgX family uracil-DNA binding protein [Parvularcula oceani]|uniref:UdgX family uracil-DNA binding protein n=1 Tax=Parvularcula oceani TaxID=1247963 RepID=UPI0004E17918|nr:UdgX family uracil-DNA binding protein [Parvularcula oceani]